MEGKINQLIRQSNIEKLLLLVLGILCLHIFVLLPLALLNKFVFNLGDKFPYIDQLIISHSFSIILLALEAVIINQFLNNKKFIVKWSYKSLIVMKILISLPIISSLHYLEVKHLGSGHVFIIYLFIHAITLRTDRKELILYSVYFAILFFGIMIFLNVTYHTNPFIFPIGIAVFSIYVFASKTLYNLKYNDMMNKQAIKEKNESLKQLNEEMKSINEELSFELKNKLLLMNRSKKIMEKISDLLAAEKLRESEIKKIKKLLLEYNDSYFFNQMENRFLELHKDFVEALVINYPDMSVNNIKLCILHKLGFSIKEIAQIRSINYNSVKVATSRLRKKVGINDSDVKLFNFFVDLEKKHQLSQKMEKEYNYQEN